MVTSNILQRTFVIRCGTIRGTCFTVDIDDRRYIVTAKHIVDGICDRGKVEILHDGRWKRLSIHLVGHGGKDTDISVLSSDVIFGASQSLVVTDANMILSEDVYFLGFPYGLNVDVGSRNFNFPLPFVKMGIVSAMPDKSDIIYLDGHNNPGFSGGPVVRRSRPDQVIGVVSGYRLDRKLVLKKSGKKGPYTYDLNTGIVLVCSARQIERIVRDN